MILHPLGSVEGKNPGRQPHGRRTCRASGFQGPRTAPGLRSLLIWGGVAIFRLAMLQGAQMAHYSPLRFDLTRFGVIISHALPI
ncbi:MAG: hypothetical protein DMG06_07735 [Acidobacteria bacterium]|nr:MAG: hypothetical protein DMG06_07735 [Acidobacteriota bacterium]